MLFTCDDDVWREERVDPGFSVFLHRVLGVRTTLFGLVTTLSLILEGFCLRSFDSNVNIQTSLRHAALTYNPIARSMDGLTGQHVGRWYAFAS